MSRRFESEKIQHIVLDNIAGPTGIILISPDNDIIIAPKLAVVGANGGGPSEFNLATNGGAFLHACVSVNDTIDINFPDGLELPQGSGVELNNLSSGISLSFYYVTHDESAGITKIQSRANSFSNVTQTRTPNNVVGQSKS